MSKKFCVSPWVNLTIFPNGDIKPCCISTCRFGNINENKIEDIINSEKAISFREKFLKDEFPVECHVCEGNEQTKGSSFRLELNERFKLDKEVNSPVIESFNPRYLDLRNSNICNFKCRICFHGLSSSWYEDEVKLNPSYSAPKFIKSDLSQVFKRIAFEKIEEVYFAGGEPLINEDHFNLLMALEKQSLFQTRIKYNTNLSTLHFRNRSYLEIWSKFPDHTIAISIDDIFERAEYSRKGTSWPVFEKNLREITSHPKINHFFFITVSLFNIANLPKVVRFLKDEGYLKNQFVKLSLLYDPDHLSIRHLPQELKEHVIEELSLLHNDFRDSSFAQEILAIQMELKRSGPPASFSTFISECKKIDSVRGERLDLVNPEYASYYRSRDSIS